MMNNDQLPCAGRDKMLHEEVRSGAVPDPEGKTSVKHIVRTIIDEWSVGLGLTD